MNCWSWKLVTAPSFSLGSAMAATERKANMKTKMNEILAIGSFWVCVLWDIGDIYGGLHL